MLHRNRIFQIANIATAEDLARKLTEHTWCCCTGFRFDGFLFLNDSTSPDGAQEYAVVRESDGRQVESITFSWCSYEEALHYVRDSGSMDMSWGKIENKIQTPEEHGSCGHCA